MGKVHFILKGAVRNLKPGALLPYSETAVVWSYIFVEILILETTSWICP